MVTARVAGPRDVGAGLVVAVRRQRQGFTREGKARRARREWRQTSRRRNWSGHRLLSGHRCVRRRRGASRWLTKASSRGGRASRSVVLASTCRLAGRGVERGAGGSGSGAGGGAGKNLGCCFSGECSSARRGYDSGRAETLDETGPGFRRGTVGGPRHSVIGAPGLDQGQLPGYSETI